MDVLDSGTMMSLNDEKHKLEAQLAGVTKLEERLKEVNKLLGKIAFKNWKLLKGQKWLLLF